METELFQASLRAAGRRQRGAVRDGEELDFWYLEGELAVALATDIGCHFSTNRDQAGTWCRAPRAGRDECTIR